MTDFNTTIAILIVSGVAAGAYATWMVTVARYWFAGFMLTVPATMLLGAILPNVLFAALAVAAYIAILRWAYYTYGTFGAVAGFAGIAGFAAFATFASIVLLFIVAVPVVLIFAWLGSNAIGI